MLGFEPRTFRMQSERSTTELHPRLSAIAHIIEKILSLIECSVVPVSYTHLTLPTILRV